jgi:hypothetical protein
VRGCFYNTLEIYLTEKDEYEFIKNALNVCGYNYTLNNSKIDIDDVVLETYIIRLDKSQHKHYPINVYKLDVGEYYGFELTGNGRFVLANGIITHNTTVARIIGELYKNMGILSANGVFRIAKREDFIAEYLGQTAIKTRKLLESCKGGVLFIDEVYSLGPGVADKDSFSKEAIDTLNLYLSEHKHEFCCIIAGYEDEIQRCFFSVNPGLERRFQWIHKIGKYNTRELTSMYYKIVNDIGWKTNITISELEKIINENESLFVHYGGDIENLVNKCKMIHAFNLINSSNSVKYTISTQDLEGAIDMIKQNRLHLPNNLYFQQMYL